MTDSALTEKVIGLAMRVHSELGAGFLESVYRNSLMHELLANGFDAKAEVPLKVFYDRVEVGRFIADIIINDELILELKAASALSIADEQQLVNYLKATGKDTGLLLNFGASRLELKKKFRKYTKQSKLPNLQSC